MCKTVFRNSQDKYLMSSGRHIYKKKNRDQSIFHSTLETAKHSKNHLHRPKTYLKTLATNRYVMEMYFRTRNCCVFAAHCTLHSSRCEHSKSEAMIQLLSDIDSRRESIIRCKRALHTQTHHPHPKRIN